MQQKRLVQIGIASLATLLFVGWINASTNRNSTLLYSGLFCLLMPTTIVTLFRCLEYRQQVQRLSHRNQLLESESEVLRLNDSHLATEIEHLNQEKLKLATSLQKSQGAKSNLQERLRQLQGNSTFIEQELLNRILLKEATLKALLKKHKALQSQCDCSQIEKEEAQAKLLELQKLQLKEQKRSGRSQQELTGKRLEIRIYKKRVRDLEQQNKRLKQQAIELEEKLEMAREIEPDNHFEKRVLNRLKQANERKKPNEKWILDTQLTTSNGAITDIIVIDYGFLAVIEAKNYAGRIICQGDPANNVWFKVENNKKIDANSRRNPYVQVSQYAHDFGTRLERRTAPKGFRKVEVYGIVVFPDDAQLSTIETHFHEFHQYYKVITLSRLVPLLQELSEEIRCHSNCLLPPQRLRDIIRGKYT